MGHSKDGFIYQLVHNDRDSVLASAGGDSSAMIWNLNSGERLATFSGHIEYVGRLAWLDEYRLLATSDAAGVIRIWSISDKYELDLIKSYWN